MPAQNQEKILSNAHDSVWSGHLGMEKTIERVRTRFYWPAWEQSVRAYVASCERCQVLKGQRVNNITPLGRVEPKHPFDIITTDIMGPMTKTRKGNTSVLVIVDHFSKYMELFALPTATAEEVTKKLMQFMSRHGIPNQILSDQGKNYMSVLLEQFCDMLDIHKMRTTAYHAQTDGLSERLIRTTTPMIKEFLDGQ